jgi:hypothetical protein
LQYDITDYCMHKQWWFSKYVQNYNVQEVRAISHRYTTELASEVSS